MTLKQLTVFLDTFQKVHIGVTFASAFHRVCPKEVLFVLNEFFQPFIMYKANELVSQLPRRALLQMFSFQLKIIVMFILIENELI